MMDIVIVGAAMPFGPDSLKYKSLGGSETAQLMLGKAFAKAGHNVIQFTNLPAPEQPDWIAPGTKAEDGVRYCPMQGYEQAICSTPHDLLIISRNLQLVNLPHQAKHAVFWAHDLATHTFMAPALAAVTWNINAVWAVSEWHRQQIHKITGYPLDRIIALRNGIVDVTDPTVVEPDWNPDDFRSPNTLVYAARPERGLEALLRPGGIMERLPEYKLRISMYAHFPDHMRGLYEWCQQRVAALPNVEYMGSLKQPEMRAAIRGAAAYVYPTTFEETSCILARECIEAKTPMLTNRVGALPETLGDCGVFLEDFQMAEPAAEWNTDRYCEQFANMVRWFTGGTPNAIETRENVTAAMDHRGDLYWSGVAADAIEFTTNALDWQESDEHGSYYSRAWSLVRDGDVIPAVALLRSSIGVNQTPGEAKMLDDLKHAYSFCRSPEALAQHYADVHEKMAAEDKHFHLDQHERVPNEQRWQAVASQLAQLPPGSKVLDYGCAEGVHALAYAKAFPHLEFVGLDFAMMAVDNARKHAAANKVENVKFFYIPEAEIEFGYAFDAAICTEVLEHQPEPWVLLEQVESYVKPGGRILLTTPIGEWETDQWEQYGRPWNRQHIWQIDQYAYEVMLADKQNVACTMIPANVMPDARIRGHMVASYTADHTPIHEIDPLKKAYRHNPRQTVTACIIAKNAAATILNTLKSLVGQVQAVKVIVDESTKDTTYDVLDAFAKAYPWIELTVITGPAIAADKWGFDDARNLSIEEIETDWFFWIDSDEYFAGDMRKYLRDNALKSYGVHQHHFTLEPRGGQPQIDRPARLCRRGLKFYGKVHEHAEVEFNGGPGYSYMINDIDIGHVGYVNEVVRRQRFERNFPFLMWDRKVNPERRLGYFLWFRDILHRMRYAMDAQDQTMVVGLANEALSFYNENKEVIMSFGMGAQQALSYLSEANRVLGKGREVGVQFTLDGQPVAFNVITDDVEHVLSPIRKLLAPELEKAASKYWR